MEVRHDMFGYYLCTEDEAEYEDEGHCSVGFDRRPHFATLQEAREALDLMDED